MPSKASKGVPTTAVMPLPPTGSSLRDPSVTKFQNPLYRSFVGFERIVVTGDRADQFLQEFQRRIDILMPVKRHKTACKQFRHRLARRKPLQHVPMPMLKNEYPCQRRAPRRRIRRLAMPRRPIHPHAARFPRFVIPSETTGRQSRAVTQSKDLVLPAVLAASRGVSSSAASSRRTIIRSSLKTSTSSRAVHSRVVVLFPAPECPTNKFPVPSGRTIPQLCNSIAFSRVRRCMISNSSKGYSSGAIACLASSKGFCIHLESCPAELGHPRTTAYKAPSPWLGH